MTDIVLEKDGKNVVRPPAGHTPNRVDVAVESKRMWIYYNPAEWNEVNASAFAREWGNGETLLYFGCGYRLSIVLNQDRELKLKDGCFCLSR